MERPGGKGLYLRYQRLVIKLGTMMPHPFEMVGGEDQSVSQDCDHAKRFIKLGFVSVSLSR
jgi:hypothetical protein